MAKANYNSERRWTKPSKRAEGYAKDRKAKVHTYGPNEGKELTEYQLGMRSGYFDCYLVDIAAIEGYEYAKYTNDGLHPNEAGMDLITDYFARMLRAVYAKPATNAETNNK